MTKVRPRGRNVQREKMTKVRLRRMQIRKTVKMLKVSTRSGRHSDRYTSSHLNTQVKHDLGIGWITIQNKLNLQNVPFIGFVIK